jgi:hypothetical protein
MNQPSTVPRHTQHRDRREAAATPRILPDPHENCAKRKARQRVKRNESALVTFCTGHERKDITPQGHQWRLQTLYRRWLCTVRCACPRSREATYRAAPCWRRVPENSCSGGALVCPRWPSRYHFSRLDRDANGLHCCIRRGHDRNDCSIEPARRIHSICTRSRWARLGRPSEGRVCSLRWRVAFTRNCRYGKTILVEQGYGVCGARDERPHAGQQQQLVDQLGHDCPPPGAAPAKPQLGAGTLVPR